jgi:serine/threonine protein phosphatase PrpC
MIFEADYLTMPGTRQINDQDRAYVSENGVFAVVDGFGERGDITAQTLVGFLGETRVPVALEKTHGLITAAFNSLIRREIDSVIKSYADRGEALDDGMLYEILHEKVPESGAAYVILSAPSKKIYHKGDCRVYRARGNDLVRLTDDSTFKGKKFSIAPSFAMPDSYFDFKNGHILLECVGGKDSAFNQSPMPNFQQGTFLALEDEIAVGDTYLLCSDGFWGVIEGCYRQNADSVLLDAIQTKSIGEIVAEALRVAPSIRDDMTVLKVDVK